MDGLGDYEWPTGRSLAGDPGVGDAILQRTIHGELSPLNSGSVSLRQNFACLLYHFMFSCVAL